KVIVKRLSAIEDLGGIQVLCTDKTGTITENKLTVTDIFSDDPGSTLKLGILAASSLDSKGTPNNSFDVAIIKKLENAYQGLLEGSKKIFEIPFNPNRRRNSALVKLGGSNQLIVRGAVESVMPYIVGLNSERNDALMNWVLSIGNQGKRIIAVAKKSFPKDSYDIPDEECDLELVGLVAFEDPIKSTTFAAIAKAKELGISPKIITGDSAEVAGAVGVKVGIAVSRSDVITGDDFDLLPHTEQKEILKRINVFARISPQQKYNIIKLLQEDFQVGFLGEGINDAPALRAAGVSIVVDHAADVSREVADVILLKHDLSVIVDGIELGRKTFVNVTNYVKATLASNFGNFYAMAFVTLVIDFLPMLPIQILLVNLLSDFPMISIATDNVARKDILNPKSYSMRELVLLATILGLVSTSFDFMMFGVFKPFGEQELQTYWFIGSILTELALIYSIRTRGWFIDFKNPPSKAILFLTFGAVLLTLAIPFTSVGLITFKFITPSMDKLGIIAFIVVGYIASTELVKYVYQKYFSPSSSPSL
ncbi:HAD-IC family P-type ATPase, partial [Patescibacteria group bacterium]|nr:HAD-IC family P-type ATPase [Patescibacteria group bacterium]